MKFLMPPLSERKKIYEELQHFFDTNHMPSFNRAIRRLYKFYRLRRPRIHFYEYINGGKHLGETLENGIIRIIHPENWKKHSKKYNSLELWQNTVIHEVMHHITWVDNENKVQFLTKKFEEKLDKAWSRKRKC